MPTTLHGYRHSGYRRIARLALEEKRVLYDRVEVNPFAPDVPAAYLAMHPFGRVPTLVHDGFALHETCAITAYVDEAFAGASLQPEDPRGTGEASHRARRAAAGGVLAGERAQSGVREGGRLPATELAGRAAAPIGDARAMPPVAGGHHRD